MKATPDESPPVPDEEAGQSRKQARRREKAEARLRRLGELPPEPRERYRILTDCISEARQLVGLTDHRARYALVIIGALNAGVVALGGGGRLFSNLPSTIKSWVFVIMVIYGLLTLAFVLFAIECLRPRPLTALGPDSAGGASRSGLLFWEAVSRQDLDRYHEAWDRVRMEQINREAEAIFYSLAHVVHSKHHALRRLYAAMVALVILATLLLGWMTWVAMRGP